jgi:hypothetical protein
MRYTKPYVVVIGPAISTVQSCNARKSAHVSEGPPCNTANGTAAAYEADE